MNLGKEFYEELNIDGIPYVRIVSPVLADENCIQCHESARVGDVLGVTDTLISSEAALERHASFMKVLFAIISIVVIFVILMLYLVTRETIVRPINELLFRVKDIAEGEGDLTKMIDVKSNDELGDLARSLNFFIDKLHTIILEISKGVHTTASSASQVSGSTQNLALGAEKQETETNQMSASLEEMSMTIKEIAKNASEASAKAADAENKAKKGGEVVSHTITGIKRIVDSSKTTKKAVENLNENTKQIENVITVIDDVANQTNLLALNAAIEAARAGDSGRGFAVVADEVRKLAERTSVSAKEITDLVKKMQKGSNQAILNVNSEMEDVQDGINLAENAGSMLGEIVGSAEAVLNLIHQVAVASEEEAAVINEISSNLDSITLVTKETTQVSQQISAATQEVSKMSDLLKEQVGKFKL